MSDTIIAAESVGKRYVLNHQAGGGGYRKFSDEIMNAVMRPMQWIRRKTPSNSREEFWALNDVSFDIKRGDVVGIIGRNGAGKSTLLKILSRITEPTTGRITLRGRVASLLEVGTGFHPELTGRENIFLNGAILGMEREEIRAKFDEIVAFAEIEKFLDTPVKRYSSGMYVRLAFAVAAHLEPEILIVDEVLAVGDTQFQRKCLGKMQDVARGGGRTVLFVSHNLSSIMNLCTKGLVLERGKLIYSGTTAGAIQCYNGRESDQGGFTRQAQANGNPTLVGGRWLEDLDGSSPRKLELGIQSKTSVATSIDLRLADQMSNAVGFASLGSLDPSEMVQLSPGLNVITLALDSSALAIGAYHLSIDLTLPEVQYFDRADRCLSLDHVRPPTNGQGRALDQSWGYGSVELGLKVI
jgi:lipopolysaccharide transport system ATP-binding protein